MFIQKGIWRHIQYTINAANEDMPSQLTWSRCINISFIFIPKSLTFSCASRQIVPHALFIKAKHRFWQSWPPHWVWIDPSWLRTQLRLRGWWVLTDTYPKPAASCWVSSEHKPPNSPQCRLTTISQSIKLKQNRYSLTSAAKGIEGMFFFLAWREAVIQFQLLKETQTQM